MPKVREPLPLIDQARLVISVRILMVVFTAKLKDCIGNQPSLVFNQIIAKTIELYVQLCVERENLNIPQALQKGCSELPSLSRLFQCLASPQVTHLDFSGLKSLGTVTLGAMSHFNKVLEQCLLDTPCLQVLILKSANSRTSLPSFDSSLHLKIIGTKCPKLRYLDLSFIIGLLSDHFLHLIPSEENAGCPALETLNIFDCGICDKVVKQLVLKLPKLTELGYKEIGRVLKNLLKENVKIRLKFTHLNCLGEKTRKTSIPSLRCNKVVANAISEICPSVTHLKVRVQDADVEALTNLENLNSVEFLYNVGKATSPFVHTNNFFAVRGQNLTSVALICYSISMIHVNSLGKDCPNLTSLWLRSHYFNVFRGCHDELPKDLSMAHDYFKKLKVLYFRVGEGELSISNMPPYVLPFILKNSRDLNELILAVRSSKITDDFIRELLLEANLCQLRKLLIVVPGLNNLSYVLGLTLDTVRFALGFCPNLNKIGNLISWSVDRNSFEFQYLNEMLLCQNFDLDLIFRNMVMH